MSANQINIILEGNTGAGKTSLCKLLEKECNATIIKEPIKKWQNIKGKGNLFDLYINNRKRWAFVFQSYAFFTFLKSCMETSEDNGFFIFDRSMYSGLLCFARMFKEEQSMTDIEYEVFQEMHTWIVEKITFQPDGFIYLKTPPEQCYERSYKRNRPEEANISMEFFTMLGKYHEDWFTHNQCSIKSLKNIPVLTIDGTLDYIHNENAKNTITQKVQTFLQQFQKNESTYAQTVSVNNM